MLYFESRMNLLTFVVADCSYVQIIAIWKLTGISIKYFQIRKKVQLIYAISSTEKKTHKNLSLLLHIVALIPEVTQYTVYQNTLDKLSDLYTPKWLERKTVCTLYLSVFKHSNTAWRSWPFLFRQHDFWQNNHPCRTRSQGTSILIMLLNIPDAKCVDS